MTTKTEQVRKDTERAIVSILKDRGAMCAPDMFNAIRGRVSGLTIEEVSAAAEQMANANKLARTNEKSCTNTLQLVYDLDR